MAVEAPAAEIYRVLSTVIDARYYRTLYPDVAAAGQTALQHYCLEGWREGRDATPWFSTEAYLARHPDVAAMGVEPLFHYLTVGRHEGREIASSRFFWEQFGDETDEPPEVWLPEGLPRQTTPDRDAEPPHVARRHDEDARVIAAEFDAAWYLATYPDIARAGADPLFHFTRAGWREGRDPNAWFSVSDYLEAHPDVAAAGGNPFVHYIAAGRAEGRALRLDLGFRYPLIAGAVPPADRLARAIAASERAATDDPDNLARALREAPGGLADLHVTFSHDDYTATVGGMQLCLRRESHEIAARGMDHLHVYPLTLWPTARADGQRGVVGVLLNGQALGVYQATDVIAAARKAVRGRPAGWRSFAIHSLLGHSTADVVALLNVFKLKAGFFWLHDFASLCAGYHLLRNDVQDCAAPPIDSPACGVCSYGPLRAGQVAAHESLFRQLDLTVVGPSETTLAFWRSRAAYPVKEAVVLPHARLVAKPAEPAATSPRRALRIAFLGMPSPLKGWPIFADLAARYRGDGRYRFLHLGGRPDPRSSVEFHAVVATEARPDAMSEALKTLEVDVALVWPLCRETFSFTAYEAAAAGCAVLTWPDSGNVAAFVAESGQGLVLESEAALREVFANGQVRQLARARRGAATFDLSYSAMTADLVPEPA